MLKNEKKNLLQNMMFGGKIVFTALLRHIPRVKITQISRKKKCFIVKLLLLIHNRLTSFLRSDATEEFNEDKK